MPADAVADHAGGRLTGLLQQLIAFPTESRGPNIELIRWVADHVESCGGRVMVLDAGGGQANLLASFGPQSHGGLMLSGHTDVVPAGTGWATEPYVLTQIGDELRGRGTADMKGFIAAVIPVLEGLRGVELQRPLHLALSFDEEVGCIGVRDALQVIDDLDDVRPDLVVVGEPTMMRPGHSHLGKLAYDVLCLTAAAHSSMSHSTPSAITSAMKLIGVLEELQQRNRPVAEPELTVNCGTIEGGTGLNVIAARCAFAFEVRHSVDHDPDLDLQPFMDAVEQQRASLAEHRGSIELTEITRYPALRTAPGDRWLRFVERIADAGPSIPIGFGTEGGLFAAALGVPVVICGPGDITVAHRPDEYVTIDQLLRCERFLGELVRQVCVDAVVEG